MFATMYVAEGVGLAATQIGVGRAVFVYDCHDHEGVQHKGHVVNPRIVATAGPEEKLEEGCLSVPGPYAVLGRPFSVTVAGLDRHGEPLDRHRHRLPGPLPDARDRAPGRHPLHRPPQPARRNRVLAEIEPFPWNGPLPQALPS